MRAQALLLLAALGAALCAAAAAGGGDSGSGGGGGVVAAVLDADRDGTVSQDEEMAVVDKLYQSLDVDQDGGITPEELLPADPKKPATQQQQQAAGDKGDKGEQDEAGKVGSDTDGDVQITRNELKVFWMASPVRTWTREQVAAWLSTVNLGEYRELFLRHKIDGRLLPALAMDNGALLRRDLGVIDPEKRQLLTLAILRMVFGVPTLIEPASRWIEITVAVVSVAIGVGSYLYSVQLRKSHDEQVALNQRLKEAQSAAHGTEQLLSRQLRDLSQQAETTTSELERMRRESEDAAVVRDDVKKLQELLQEQHEARKQIKTWLARKYQQEARMYTESWQQLSARLSASRSRANQIIGNSNIFSKSSKALEHTKRVEEIEIEMQSWQTAYKRFLEAWLPVAEMGYINAPDLGQRLRDLTAQQSEQAASTATVSKAHLTSPQSSRLELGSG